MTYIEKLTRLNSLRSTGKWAQRIVSELVYLDSISKHSGGKYDADIEKAADLVLSAFEDEGAVTKASVLVTEESLSHLSPVAKSYKELFIGHAHIDMNWMWSYNETACVAVDTFRTVLDLMKAYPDFTFGQSQASTYEIVEKYCPELLDDIKERIREGRWVVTASEWVEPDKNMPDGESLSRQILQTKKYLAPLLGIDPETLDFDFVPDTFGHNVNVPEILANAGVKYLYHWRGCEENPRIYYFVSPSGKKVLTYREFICYLGDVTTEKFEIVPEFAAETGLDTYLCVFGVGDHGGGPTMRDIERIEEYKTWPLTPTISFGTYRQFFEIIEKSGIEIPEVKKELNFLFTGCYTSQSRIKMANRFGEARINQSEQLAAAASLLAGTKRDPSRLDRAWRNILFAHFHDILPGSGVLETREHALGTYQETLAYTNVYAGTSMRAIAAQIDTTSIPFVRDAESRSEGAGSGYNGAPGLRWTMPVCERGNGPVRAYHIFNTTGLDRDEATKVTLWNYEGNPAFFTADGKPLESCKLFEGGEGWFWGHWQTTYLVRVKVPALGYTTVIVKPDFGGEHLDLHRDEYIRDNEPIEPNVPVVLENEYIKASFDKMTMQIIELIDKSTGETLIDKPSGSFKLVYENSRLGMTSWKIGNFTKEVNLHEEATVRLRSISGGLAQGLSYVITHGETEIEVKVTLPAGAKYLDYDIHVLWWEKAPKDRTLIPQLSFSVPVSYERTGNCIYDIPYGKTVRPELAHDVPALSYLGIESRGEESIGLVTDTKYGFRCYDGKGEVDLLRQSFDPDIYPEYGHCFMHIGIMAAPVSEMGDISVKYNHPMTTASASRHGGPLPFSGTAAKVEGNVKLSCMKNSENGLGTAFRVYDVTGRDQPVRITVAGGVRKAYLTDSNENVLSELEVRDGFALATVPALDFITVVTE